ncbi:Por secretion system C-terminal sorting domain-containing protein [Lishizhenia tianjinensis]|uniref:Por secretion system C-terminal sorting domain-containing protein n=1 Tax=Lishizhenia tianjinensis TaxID=477690 RepID=A0A1I7A0N8_9FLAO|nr:M14 family zinc carboxypeptidase [Lishizhenia tianjinensis]SFT68462.1 Por secretion system C-terminal sorting domain-containing protein [Lishizhenia tianjinensis]
MRLLLLVCLSFLCFFSIAQEYSRVKIWSTTDQLQELNALGLALDDVQYKKNTFIIGDFSTQQISAVQNAGFQVDILIEDVVEYYVQNSTSPLVKNTGCALSVLDTLTNPTNFHNGTYAGYYTYNEFLTELDEMYAAYPNLISQKAAIAASPVDTTLEGRPLYLVKISDNPNLDEAEPEVLYTSIHHAREPGSLIQNIYFMWYLLENYGSDPAVTYLLDNTELYFIPMINPDGYVYNETTNPFGGGMHRKNRRNVGTFNKGVDLNRNYSYQWGTTGVDLSNQNSDVYPGTGAFSENETQIVKWFIENHNILFASNAHTHGDLLLYPVGATVAELAVDHDYFHNYTHHMAEFNGYQAMKSSGLYPASGDSDDYMYKDHGVYAITPEIGNGFWPPVSAIEGMCKEMLHPNLTTGLLTHKYGTIEDQTPLFISATTGDFSYEFQRLGLENGAIDVTIHPIQGIQSVGNGNSHDIAFNTPEQGTISYQLDANLQLGDLIVYEYHLDFGGYVKKIRKQKFYGVQNTVFQDNISSIQNSNWLGIWGATQEAFVSANYSMTDSPNDNYSDNVFNELVLNDTIDLTDVELASVSFFAKWDIEKAYDYVQFQVSTDFGLTWLGQCGLYTVPGADNGSIQPIGLPLYDGTQSEWVEEYIDLSDYFGQQIMLRFILRSDNFTTGDGFYFDDFRVNVNYTNSVNNPVKDFLQIYPNPTAENLTVKLGATLEDASFNIYSLEGKLLQVVEVNPQDLQQELKVADLAKGMYILKLVQSEKELIQRKFVKL